MRKHSPLLSLFFIIIVSTRLYAQIPTSGLVAYYPFNGNANDGSGNGHNGINVGASLTSDRFGNKNSAYSFNGTGAKITLNQFPTNFEDVSICAWAKPASINESRYYQIFDTWQDYSYTPYRLAITGLSPVRVFTSFENPSGSSALHYQFYKPNEWHFFTGVRKKIATGYRLELYIDGLLVAKDSSASSPLTTMGLVTAHIGAIGNGTMEYFSGCIDDVRIYNRVITSTEITSLYTEGSWPQTAPVLDIDGNTYDTVKIGTQTWMKQNLKTTKYNDGTAIPNITDNATWTGLTSGAYCWYNNDPAANKANNGALYNWYALDMTGNGGKNVCPTSWHVPSDAEWTTLTTYSAGESVAGGKLKETGTSHWQTPNTGATNETGFTALPGGYRELTGAYYDIGQNGVWWSSTGLSSANAWYRNMGYNNANVYRSNYNKPKGFSVRCLKNDLNNGLVAYYPFTGNSNDESGNSYNGTNNGATLITDRFGNANKAYSFDGANDYISCGALHPVYTNFSLSLWINPSRLIDEPDGILGDACSQQGLLVQQNNGILTFTTQGGGSLVSTTLTIQDLNQWAHYTFVMDQGAATLYKNGIVIGSGTQGLTPPTGAANFEMGRDMCQSSLYWKGSLDDIRMYNRALSSSEINDLYHEDGWGLPPTITSFTPTYGPVGTSVTISGTNFNTTPANNIVWFGAVKGTVTAATTTQLTVTVPIGATYQPINVTNVTNGLSANSNAPFNVTFPSSQIIDATTFASRVDFSTGTGPYITAIGDIDGDGKPDLIVSNSTSNTITVYRNTSTSGTITAGSFATGVDFNTGISPTFIAIGDIDGDGKPDLAVTNASSNTVSVFRNTSVAGSFTTGSFAAKVDLTTGANPYGICMGDLDGDGKPDLAITNYVSSTISLFQNISSSGSITTSSFASRVDLNTETYPYGITISDIDGDGKLDLAVVNHMLNYSVSVFRNISTPGTLTTGSFMTKVDFATGGVDPFDIAIGDIDGDSKKDLVVTNYSSNSISIFRNTSTSGSIGTTSFASRIELPTGTHPQCITMGDLDGDNKPDLAVTNFSGNSVSLYRNISTAGTITTGSFANKVDFTTGTNPFGVTIADIDGDGKPDLTVTNNTSNTVTVFRNTISVNGLIAYYPFNGNANDESGNGNNGTVSGATLTTDRFGNANKAYSFDGVNDFINLGNPLSISTSFAFSGWYKYDNLSNDWSTLFTKEIYWPDFGVMYNKNGFLRIYNNNSTGIGDIPFQPVLSKWFHFVLTYDGSIIKVYINGNLLGSISYSSVINDATNLYIGANGPADSYAYPFPGSIDDIRVYNIAISVSDINSLYHENGYAQVTDIDGNVYGTVTIGTQTWMQENLKVTSFKDGSLIPNVADNNSWNGLTTAAYAWYNNDAASYKNLYGALYNWHAVNTGKLCPTGWHVPSDAEWATLETYLGGSSVAGGKLKESGTSHWVTPNTGATNETGFTSLPAGYRGLEAGTGGGMGTHTHFWPSSDIGGSTTWDRYLYYDDVIVHRENVNKIYGFSVRCLKDATASAPVANSATSMSQTSFSANWSASSGATGYVLDVATDNVFSSYVTGFRNKDVSTVTTYSVTGLTASTNYYYRLRAYSTTDTSSYSNVIPVTTLINPPSAPAVSSATSNTQTGFTANWNSSPTSAGYYLDVATDNTFSSLVSGYNEKDVSNVTSYAVTGLTANTIYYYRVRAYNAGGTSPSSNTITTQTLPNAPSAPVASAASANSQDSFTANWTASSGATGYYIDVSTDISFSSFFNGYNNKDVSNITSYSVTGLTASTTFYYRVRAYNTGGTSSSSNTITTATTAVSGLSAPVATAATSQTQTSFAANWNAVGAATGYYLDVATDNSFISIVTGYNNKDVLNVTTYTVTGLSPNTTYYFRVSAYNGGGTSANSNVISTNTLTIPAPSAPVAISSTSVLQTSFSANWNSSSTATGYYLDVSTDNSFASYVTGYNNKNVLNVTSYTVTGLTSNTTYFLRVRAYNTGGTSSSSNVIPVSTLIDAPVPPTSTAFTSASQSSFTANWNSSSGATGYYLDIATDNTFATFVSGYNNKDVLNVTNYSVTGLSANTSYYYRVRAYNPGGTSSNSNIITAATLPVPPSAPTALGPTSVLQNSFTANWSTSSGATGYYLDVSTDNSFSAFVSGYNNKDVFNVTSYSLTGLTDNITYYYRLRAYNSGGSSSSSNTISVTTLPDAPTVTTTISATSVLQTGFIAHWNSSPAATGYYLDVSTDITFSTTISGYNSKDVSNVTSFAVTGLSPATIYCYRVRAYNSGGTSPSSNATTVITLPNPPAAPVANAATSVLQTTFSVSWSVSAGATGYYLDVALDNSFTTFVSGFNNKDMANNTTIGVTGLTANTIYYYRVRAYNSGGTSSSSNTITTTTLPDPPTVTTTTSASSVSQTSFVANWNSSLAATGYYLDVSTDITFSTTISGYNSKDVTNVTSFTVTGLSPATIYCYRVRAYNSGGTSPSSNATTVTTLPNPPAAPVANAATSVLQTTFSVSWSVSAGATGYYLDVAIDNSFTTFVSGFNNKDMANNTTIGVTGLTANTTYYYRVRAYNTGGTGSNSNTITVTTLPDPPTVPSVNPASSISQTGFTANWDLKTGATGYYLDVATDISFTSMVSGYNSKDVLNVTSFNVTGLTASTTYFYRLRAYNSGGTSPSSSAITVTTLPNPPVAPVAISATAISQTVFTANWNSSLTATGYYLDVATDVTFTSFVLGYNNKDVTNVTIYNITGLSANTTYYYRLRAYNTGGTGSNSNTITVTTLPDPPAAPVAIAATAMSQTLFTANWNSSSTATGYFLDVATNSTFTSFVSGYNNKNVSNVTGYSITGLTANAIYYYRLRSYNSGGTSSNSNIITVTTLPDPPAAPVSNAGTAISQTSFTANWSSSSLATGYYLDVSLNNAFSSFISGFNNKDVSTATSYGVTGLSAGITYYYRVRAYNTGGSSSSSSVITVSTVPDTPVSLNAAQISQNTFTAKWNSSIGVTGYKIDVSADAGFTTLLSGYSNKDTLAVTSCVIKGLSVKTTYYYRIRAYNSGGTSGNSNTITVTTLPNPPASPNGLAAKSCNNNVTLTWNPNSESGFLRYRIYGGLSANSLSLIDSTTTNVISETSKIMAGLVNSQTYYFKISAVISPGVESTLTGPVTIKVKTGVIPKISTKWNGGILLCSNLGDSIKTYQWYKDGASLSDGKTQHYVAKGKPGVYKITTTDIDGCVNTSVNKTVSGSKSLSIYPNPASTSFSVSLANESYGKTTIDILTPAGVKVMELKTEKLTDEFIREIPVENLLDGIYFLHIRINNEETIYTKIVVQK